MYAIYQLSSYWGVHFWPKIGEMPQGYIEGEISSMKFNSFCGVYSWLDLELAGRNVLRREISVQSRQRRFPSELWSRLEFPDNICPKVKSHIRPLLSFGRGQCWLISFINAIERNSHFSWGNGPTCDVIFGNVKIGCNIFGKSELKIANAICQFERIFRYIPPPLLRTFVIPHWQYVYFLTSFNLNE